MAVVSSAPAHKRMRERRSAGRARVMITKIGLDGHDRGSRIVAAYLRDAGMEVIYTGPWQPIEAVVNVAAQEDIDVIGVSALATDHLLVPKLIAALREAGLDRVKVVVGGIVPEVDEAMLFSAGVSQIFHPGSSKDHIVGSIRRLSEQAREQRV